MRAPDGAIKLGYSADPIRRRDEIANQIGEDGLELLYQTKPIERVEETERLAHRMLALLGKHIRTEWFEATLDQAHKAIRIAKRQAEGLELPLGARLKHWSDDRPMRHAEVVRIFLPKKIVATIDAIRAKRLDPRDRGAVVRELVAEALTARAKKAGR
jgi:hypothetical protein